MKKPREKQPVILREIKMRWWGYTVLPILAGLYASANGWLPMPLVALFVFCFVFWAMSGIVALVMLVLGKKPTEPPVGPT